jgi:hypothetical protein
MKGKECEVRGVLHEVFHVLGLINNLFSVKKATIQGLKVEFEQKKCNIKNNVGEILAKLVKENRLYILLCSHVSTCDNVQITQKKKKKKLESLA